MDELTLVFMGLGVPAPIPFKLGYIPALIIICSRIILANGAPAITLCIAFFLPWSYCLRNIIPLVCLSYLF
jgi:hypothetical protein